MSHFKTISGMCLCVILAAQVLGCQAYYRFAKYTWDDEPGSRHWLVDHPSPAVSLPASFGGAVGSAVSLPLQFVYEVPCAVYDVTHEMSVGEKKPVLAPDPIGEDEQKKYDDDLDADANNARLAPLTIGTAIGQHAFGLPAWVLFGWWWPSKPTPPQQTRPKPPVPVIVAKPAHPPAARPLPASDAPDHPAMVYGGGYIGAFAYSPDNKLCVIGRGKYLILTDPNDGRCLRVFAGHEGRVAWATFSSDGSRIVTSSFMTHYERDNRVKANQPLDYTARLWEVSSGRCLRVFRGHTDSIVGLAISDDGKRIFTGSDDGTAKLWNANTGECLLTLTGHKQGIGAVAISPSGDLLATGSGDFTARIWEAASGRCLHVLEAHENTVLSVNFSPDGTRLVTGSADTTARVWDAGTGKEVLTLKCADAFDSHVGMLSGGPFLDPPPPSNMVLSVAFTADGSKILTGTSSGGTIVWDAITGRREHKIYSLVQSKQREHDKDPGWCHLVVFSRDGSRVMTGAGDKLVRLWDASAGKCLQTLGGISETEIRSFAVAPDGGSFAIGSQYRQIGIWDAADGRLVKILQYASHRQDGCGDDSDVIGLGFSGDGSKLFAASGVGICRFWQLPDGKQTARLRPNFTKWTYYSSGSSNGNLAAMIDQGGNTYLFDFDREQSLQSYKKTELGGDFARCAIDSKNRKLIGTSCGKTTWVNIWDVANGRLDHSIDIGRATWDVAYSNDGRFFLTGWQRDRARLWNANDASCYREFKLPKPATLPPAYGPAISSFAISPDSKYVAAGLVDGGIVIWRVQDGSCVRSLNGHVSRVNYARFSPNGLRLFTASEDGQVLLWQTPSD